MVLLHFHSFAWQGFSEILAGRLINSVVEGLAIALLASLLLRTLVKHHAGTRFAVLLAALAAIAALPLAESCFLPGSLPSSTLHSALRLPASWATVFLIIWAVIAASGLAKIALGFLRLHQLRKHCINFDSEHVDPALRTALRQFASDRRFKRREVQLYTSDEVRVPTAIGFLKPAIIIPSWALRELSSTELNAVVLHELAHLRRRDDWTNLAQQIIRAILFFHPAVWWIGRGLAREREMACDDFVISATSDRRAYAECLVSVAEKTFLRRGLALAQALVGRVHLTAQRVARILSPERPARPLAKIWSPAFALIAVFSSVCLVTLTRLPQLVAFDGSSAGAQSAFAPRSSETLPAINPGLKIIPASFNGDLGDNSLGNRVVDGSHIPSQLSSPSRSSFSANRNANLSASQDSSQDSSQEKIASNHTAGAYASSRAAALMPAIARQHPSKSLQPRAIQVAFDGVNRQPEAVLVMMQSRGVNEDGQVWTVCVWRFTVFHPAEKIIDQSLGKGIVPKSI